MVLGRDAGSLLVALHLCIAFLVIPVRLTQSAELQLEYSWSALDFEFPTEEDRVKAIENGRFNQGQLVPMDVQLYDFDKDGSIVPKTFVTIPRFQEGVPITLGYITDRVNDKNEHLIAPYPDFEMQDAQLNPDQQADCSRLVNVYRMAIDSSARLWVLDSGKKINDQICPPKVIAFLLETNEIVKQYEFPQEQYVNTSDFITFVVDERDSSNNVFLYIADPDGYGLMVYDEENERSWRIVNERVFAEENHKTFNIDNVSFDYMNGIFSLGLGPLLPNGDRMLFFHGLSSLTETYVPTSIIRNHELFDCHPGASADSFKSVNELRTSQSAAEAMDSNGVLFYSLTTEAAIGCLNTNDLASARFETILTNRETLQFPCAMKITKRKADGSEELWVVSNRFQLMMSVGRYDPNEVNFRIQKIKVADLVEGTNCQSKKQCRRSSHGDHFRTHGYPSWNGWHV